MLRPQLTFDKHVCKSSSTYTLISDIDVFQSSLQSYIYLEMLHLCGNPAVESLEDKDR